ncbi:helix-turn-helix domain-containing protein [Pedobacter sp. UBA4863]|uniref:XRE family transcriptional regulator n=1 Tax=Pedobacter sp. UBA4863 TaxID=1947060 RepID=UPI0025D89443|nr:helix-turn-helix domain-containing protein [Pedobacter sp. UBA4863]
MGNQKQFWVGNLKFLRERKKMTQDFLANELKISRSKLATLESGRTTNPLLEDVVNFSRYFKVSVDTLITVDLSKIGELRLRELEAGNDVYLKGGNLRVLAITVDRSNRENVEYVSVKAKAGYKAGYHDPSYIAELPKLSLPNLKTGNTYRMFPTTGDSMLPIPEGSDILTKYVTDMGSIKAGTLCIVILREEQDFVFKKVTVLEKSFLLESLNLTYEPYEVAAEDVLELWEFEKFMSGNIPEGSADMDTVLRYIKEMQQDIHLIKAREGKSKS